MKWLFVYILLFTAGQAFAQVDTTPPDTAASHPGAEIKVDSSLRPLLKPFYMRQLYAPAALMTTGIISTTLFTAALKYRLVAERNEHLDGFRTHVDDYLQYAPVPIAYGLDALGVKSKNDVWNRSLILFKGEAMMLISVTALKYTTKVLRPDEGNIYSFPSGHTAQAFAAATFLSEEYKGRFPWMPYLAYGMAGTTGLLRMANNRHFIGDVLMGAGLGILSMKVSYWTHQYRWGSKRRRR